MESTKTDHLSEERLQQNNLKKLRRSFNQATVLSKKVVECKAVNWEANMGVSEGQYIMSIDSHRFPAKFEHKDDLIDNVELNSTPLYATLYEIQYKNIKRTIISKVYHTKGEAIKEINEDKRPFNFTINDKSMIYMKESFENQEYIVRDLKNKSNIFEAYLSTLKQTPKGAFSLLASLPVISLLISLNITRIGAQILTLNTILSQVLLLGGFTIIISLILFYIILTQGQADAYTTINIPQSVIESNVVYDYEDDFNTVEDLDEYESVKCHITKNKEGIRFTSVDDIDCEWFYKRKDNGLLTEEGQEFINKIDSIDNYCILTIVNSVDEDDKFVSTDKEWRVVNN